MDLYGLIGNPVSHSLSEKYFTDKFKVEGINARYERFLLERIEALPVILKAYPALMGLNITSPFKEAVIKYCDELDETASAIRAVNTLRISRSVNSIKLKGYNTDVDGFAASLIPKLGRMRPDALILGSGGAARAIAMALFRIGIKYQVVSRIPGTGILNYKDLYADVVRNNKLIINATPLGMGNLTGQCPDIPFAGIGKKHIIYDLIYNPVETEFLRRSKAKGATVINGLMMLQAQAELSWQIWQKSGK
ncbi:MAG TPA: shikimate dehydrogenase [Bacteroidales bacterium]|nr:shikimate dehydrogenase [Bacteroidales bacterium]